MQLLYTIYRPNARIEEKGRGSGRPGENSQEKPEPGREECFNDPYGMRLDDWVWPPVGRKKVVSGAKRGRAGQLELNAFQACWKQARLTTDSTKTKHKLNTHISTAVTLNQTDH